MKDGYNWIGAYVTLCCNPNPRGLSAFGLTTEIWAIRQLAMALFGWLP